MKKYRLRIFKRVCGPIAYGVGVTHSEIVYVLYVKSRFWYFPVVCYDDWDYCRNIKDLLLFVREGRGVLRYLPKPDKNCDLVEEIYFTGEQGFIDLFAEELI